MPPSANNLNVESVIHNAVGASPKAAAEQKTNKLVPTDIESTNAGNAVSVGIASPNISNGTVASSNLSEVSINALEIAAAQHCMTTLTHNSKSEPNSPSNNLNINRPPLKVIRPVQSGDRGFTSHTVSQTKTMERMPSANSKKFPSLPSPTISMSHSHSHSATKTQSTGTSNGPNHNDITNIRFDLDDINSTSNTSILSSNFLSNLLNSASKSLKVNDNQNQITPQKSQDKLNKGLTLYHNGDSSDLSSGNNNKNRKRVKKNSSNNLSNLNNTLNNNINTNLKLNVLSAKEIIDLENQRHVQVSPGGPTTVNINLNLQDNDNVGLPEVPGFQKLLSNLEGPINNNHKDISDIKLKVDNDNDTILSSEIGGPVPSLPSETVSDLFLFKELTNKTNQTNNPDPSDSSIVAEIGDDIYFLSRMSEVDNENQSIQNLNNTQLSATGAELPESHTNQIHSESNMMMPMDPEILIDSEQLNIVQKLEKLVESQQQEMDRLKNTVQILCAQNINLEKSYKELKNKKSINQAHMDKLAQPKSKYKNQALRLGPASGVTNSNTVDIVDNDSIVVTESNASVSNKHNVVKADKPVTSSESSDNNKKINLNKTQTTKKETGMIKENAKSSPKSIKSDSNMSSVIPHLNFTPSPRSRSVNNAPGPKSGKNSAIKDSFIESQLESPLIARSLKLSNDDCDGDFEKSIDSAIQIQNGNQCLNQMNDTNLNNISDTNLNLISDQALDDYVDIQRNQSLVSNRKVLKSGSASPTSCTPALKSRTSDQCQPQAPMRIRIPPAGSPLYSPRMTCGNSARQNYKVQMASRKELLYGTSNNNNNNINLDKNLIILNNKDLDDNASRLSPRHHFPKPKPSPQARNGLGFLNINTNTPAGVSTQNLSNPGLGVKTANINSSKEKSDLNAHLRSQANLRITHDSTDGGDAKLCLYGITRDVSMVEEREKMEKVRHEHYGYVKEVNIREGEKRKIENYHITNMNNRRNQNKNQIQMKGNPNQKNQSSPSKNNQNKNLNIKSLSNTNGSTKSKSSDLEQGSASGNSKSKKFNFLYDSTTDPKNPGHLNLNLTAEARSVLQNSSINNDLSPTDSAWAKKHNLNFTIDQHPSLNIEPESHK